MKETGPTIPQNPEADLDKREAVVDLLAALHSALPALESLLAEASSHWGYEDPIYRFYHQSFKLYSLQAMTERIVASLQALAPETPLNSWFLAILESGTGKTFESSQNKDWVNVTRPIVEAFFHARYFLEMAVRYGRELEDAPAILPSGWAAFLYLYNLRLG